MDCTVHGMLGKIQGNFYSFQVLSLTKKYLFTLYNSTLKMLHGDNAPKLE